MCVCVPRSGSRVQFQIAESLAEESSGNVQRCASEVFVCCTKQRKSIEMDGMALLRKGHFSAQLLQKLQVSIDNDGITTKDINNSHSTHKYVYEQENKPHRMANKFHLKGQQSPSRNEVSTSV